MTNIYDFNSHKKALDAKFKTLDTEQEGPQRDINTEIEWASKEIEIVRDSLEALHDEILLAESYKLEVLTYLAGMEMAEKLMKGEPLKAEDFWTWFDEVLQADSSEETKQLEIVFEPDFEVTTDE